MELQLQLQGMYHNLKEIGCDCETGYSFTLQKKENPTEYEYIHDWIYDTYEEAVEEGIKYCLTLIK